MSPSHDREPARTRSAVNNSPDAANSTAPGRTAILWAYDDTVPDNATADNFLQRLVRP